MDTNAIIQIINATAGSLNDVIKQVAWMVAIQKSAQWFSFSFPCIIMFTVMSKLAKTLREGKGESATAMTIVAWLILCASIYTSVQGIAQIAMAATSPHFYVGDSITKITEMMGQKK